MDRIIKSINVYLAEDFNDEIEVNFRYLDTSVISEGKNLVFTSIKKIDLIDSSHEINRYIRPDILTIESILCYFSGYPFTVYEEISSHSTMTNEVTLEISTSKLIINGIDYTIDLEKLLSALNNINKRPLGISLLDRWRKARYMEKESEVNTFHDEAILAYFHILELIASEYYNEFKADAELKIETFIKDYCSNTLKLTGSQLNNATNSKFKVMKEFLINEEVSINTKIYYFLERFSMLDEKTYSLVTRLIKNKKLYCTRKNNFSRQIYMAFTSFFLFNK